MNNCVVKNYEEFKELFVREDGTRKNGILLAFHLNRELITLLRKEGVCTADIKSMPALKTAMLDFLSFGTIAEGSEVPPTLAEYVLKSGYWTKKYRVKLMKYEFCSNIYATDEAEGLCFDGDFRQVRYLKETEEGQKAYKMKASKLFHRLVDEHPLGEIVGEKIRLWLDEEIQKDWEAYTNSTIGDDKYKLFVDDNFRAIYSQDECKGNFHSCMAYDGDPEYNDDCHTEFYEECVKAKAAYLKDNDDKIVARCVVFTEVHDDDSGEVLRLAERQYSTEGSELLKRLLVQKLINGGYIDGYKAVGADCSSSRRFLSNDGDDWSDRRFSIECTVRPGDIISYQDSFKWLVLDDERAYNYSVCDALDLSTTSQYLNGEYDDYHDRYVESTVEVHYHGEIITCDSDDLEDFRRVRVGSHYEYFHEDDVEQCPVCGAYFAQDEGYYSELTEGYYCCEDCMETDEDAYKRDNWEYSEYDEEYYETVESYYVAPGKKSTISEDSLDDAIERVEIVEINGKYYEVSAIETIFEA